MANISNDTLSIPKLLLAEITAADDHTVSDEYRQTIRERIAHGVKSLREGRFTDGKTFMATMDAGLAALESQDHE
jgi:hypothetical protein